MHLLYVVDFDVNAANEADSAFALLLDHVASWLNRGSDVVVLASDLSESGRAALPPLEIGTQIVSDRLAVWGDHTCRPNSRASGFGPADA